MNEFAYLANPLAFNTSATLKSVATLNVPPYAKGWDLLRMALEDTEIERRAIRIEKIYNYFQACMNYTSVCVSVLGIENGSNIKSISELSAAAIMRAKEWGTTRDEFVNAARQYWVDMNFGDASAIGVGPVLVYSGSTSSIPAPGKAVVISVETVMQRVGECLALIQSNPDIGADPRTLANQKRIQWQAALVDARRIETDAKTVISALQDIELAWMNAGDYPDQVRTVSGMIQDAVGTKEWAENAARIFASLVPVAETIANTGVGTLPPDPVLGSVVPLPTVLPARPDGTVPVVTFTPATTVPTVADTGTPVVQGRKAGAFPILATLLTLITLFN